jgi:post-segregation antitoxin (ccd killing protein)
MKEFTERKTIMISKTQSESLDVLKSYNVNVSKFIRTAIREKLKRDWKSIKEKQIKGHCPF